MRSAVRGLVSLAMKRLFLLLLVVVAVALLLGAWKWGSSPGHRTAGWTWDDGQSVYVWVDPTSDQYPLDNSPS
jgi:hypothetical protein